ncbi:phage major capsid protein [Paenibacillus tyrfis]|uniref:phage major capsid protein n=1 Tax=Paenibacillus tyrfis TaxID=1501230 RepID=UPI000B58E5BE|nr:phage major capsid protein [Paenibacillus tyrfis]
MGEKERELRQALSTKLHEARTLAEQGKMEEARAAADAAKELRKQVDMLEELRGIDTPAAPAINPTLIATPEERTDKASEEQAGEYRRVFYKALRNRNLSSDERSTLETGRLHDTEERAGMSGGVAEDGGLIVPQDISTDINKLKRQYISLEHLVRPAPVSTASGSRVIEKNADLTVFAEITENTDISDMDNPKFRGINYAIKARGGILPISNSLLNDTDQNLMEHISEWISKKSTFTRHKLIIDLLGTLTKVPLTDLKSIKKVLNVTLDPSIALGAQFVTNQDGLQYLDEWMDGQGRPLLQPDPTQPTKKLLLGLPLVVVSNKWLPTSGTKKVPFIVGDLKEAIVIFDRQQYSIASTNVGGKAFVRNTTDVRAIQREDVKFFDSDAVVYGELALP